MIKELVKEFVKCLIFWSSLVAASDAGQWAEICENSHLMQDDFSEGCFQPGKTATAMAMEKGDERKMLEIFSFFQIR